MLAHRIPSPLPLFITYLKFFYQWLKTAGKIKRKQKTRVNNWRKKGASDKRKALAPRAERWSVYERTAPLSAHSPLLFHPKKGWPLGCQAKTNVVTQTDTCRRIVVLGGFLSEAADTIDRFLSRRRGRPRGGGHRRLTLVSAATQPRVIRRALLLPLPLLRMNDAVADDGL